MGTEQKIRQIIDISWASFKNKVASGMYDYWTDIENIEQYSILENYSFGTQLTLTDDPYYVTGNHSGKQTSVYSTSSTRKYVTGILEHSIANRIGRIELNGNYSMDNWEQIEIFNFIRQENNIKT